MTYLQDLYERSGPKPVARLPKTQLGPEDTPIPAARQGEYESWLQQNQITDNDLPDSHYDYRGAFLAGLKRSANGHWPDTYKQHGEDTFSEESKYSTGPGDGGTWHGPNHDQFQPPPGSTTDLQARYEASRGHTTDLQTQFDKLQAVSPGEKAAAGAYFQGSSEDEQPVPGQHLPTPGERLREVDQFVRKHNATIVDPDLRKEAVADVRQLAGGTAELGLGMAKTWPTLGAFVWRGQEGAQAAAAPFERASEKVAEAVGPPQSLVQAGARTLGPFAPGAAFRAFRMAQAGREAAAILPRIEGSLTYAKKVDELGQLGAADAQRERMAGYQDADQQMTRDRVQHAQHQELGNQLGGLFGQRNQGLVDQLRGIEASQQAGADWRAAGLDEMGGLLKGRQSQLEAAENQARTVANNPSEMGALGRQFDAWKSSVQAEAARRAPAREAFPSEARSMEQRYPDPNAPLPPQVRKGRNGRKGQIPVEALSTLAGGAAGAVHGYTSADPEDSKVTRVVTQGLLGAAGGYAMAQGAGMLAASRRPSFPAPVQAAYDRAQASIDWGGKVQRQVDRAAAGGFLARLQAISENVANGKAPLERLGRTAETYGGLRPTRNPRYLMSYVKSEDQTIHMAMTEGVPDPVTRVPVGIGYQQVFAPFGGDEEKIKQGLTYVMAERGVARGPSAYGQNLQGYQDDVTLVNHLRGDQSMLDFRDRVENYVDGLGNYAVRSGLWTKQQWAGIRASDAVYVPWKRVMEDFLRQQHPGVGGSGLANVTAGIKRFVGSGRIKADPALALAEYTQAIIRRADRYRVGSSIFTATDAMGPAGDLILTRIPAPLHTNPRLSQAVINQTVAQAQAQGIHLNQATIETLDDLHTPVFDNKTPQIWRNAPNGQGREWGQLNVPSLWRAVQKLNQLDDDGLRTFLDLTIRPFKRLFVAATTGLTPRFAGGTNPVRDAADAMAKTQAGMTPGDWAVGWASAIGGKSGVAKNELYQTSQRFGLGSVSNFSYPTSAKSYQHMFAPTSKLDKMKALGRATGALPIRPFEAFGEVSDLGPRLGELRAAMRQKQGLVDAGHWTEPDLKLYGNTLGREVTLDFQNKPGNSVLKLLADYVPFFGPSVQAPVAMLGALRRNPARVLSATVGAAVIPATIAWAMKHRSQQALDKTNDRNPGERGAFMLFPLDDEGNVTVRVTLSQEMGIVAAGVTAGLDAWVDQDPHGARVFQQALFRALPPIGVPVLNALIENARNKRSFGDTPVEPHRLLEEKPEDRRLPTTSPTFDVLARAARASGIFPNASPLQAENVVHSVFSNTTPGLTEVTDPIAERLGGVHGDRKLPVPWRQNPLNPFGTFFATPTPRTTASEQDYYRMRESITQARASATTAIKSGSEPDIDRIFGKYENELGPRARSVLRSADKHLKAFREGEVKTQADYRAGALTGEEARQALDDYQRQRQETYRIAVDLLREATAK